DAKGGDAEAATGVATVADTAEKRKAGAHTTGWSSLGKLLGGDCLRRLLQLLGVGRQEVAAYAYHDADGALSYEVVRFEPGKNGAAKAFLQRRPFRGSWAWGRAGGCYRQQADGTWTRVKGGTHQPGDLVLMQVPTVPYRLPQLLAADPTATVFVPEGEKKVEALAGLGLVATCN